MKAFIELLFAVDYIHQRGILHNDIKPENILLKSSSSCDLDCHEFPFTVKLADFGDAFRIAQKDAEMRSLQRQCNTSSGGHIPMTAESPRRGAPHTEEEVTSIFEFYVNNNDRAREYRGTPEFRCPEAELGGYYDSKADIWALGICLCEFLVGKTPFTGVKTHEVL
eukprot:GHVQ01033010.1.p1 GENE.GHVQ01033010.1~~GHVQ01033010.1.p1  ORF type:complete len:166 (-),score=19.98 GHVQ01033010.1:1429-1926(-)